MNSIFDQEMKKLNNLSDKEKNRRNITEKIVVEPKRKTEIFASWKSEKVAFDMMKKKTQEKNTHKW